MNRQRGISGGTEVVTFTELGAINRQRGISGATETVTFDEQQATINRGFQLVGTTEVVTFVETGTVNRARTVVGTTEVISFVETGSINRQRGVTGLTEVVTFVENTATIDAGQNNRDVVCTSEAISFVEQAATVGRDRFVGAVCEVLNQDGRGFKVRFLVLDQDGTSFDVSKFALNQSGNGFLWCIAGGGQEAIVFTENIALIFPDLFLNCPTEAITFNTSGGVVTILCRNIPAQDPSWSEIPTATDTWNEILPTQIPANTTISPSQAPRWDDGSICDD